MIQIEMNQVLKISCITVSMKLIPVLFLPLTIDFRHGTCQLSVRIFWDFSPDAMLFV